jgi:hypothetical protein
MAEMNAESSADRDTGDAVVIAGTAYRVWGRVSVFDRHTFTCHVVIALAAETWVTCKTLEGHVTDVPLYSRSFSAVLEGFTLRCGTPLRSICPSPPGDSLGSG